MLPCAAVRHALGACTWVSNSSRFLQTASMQLVTQEGDQAQRTLPWADGSNRSYPHRSQKGVRCIVLGHNT